MWLLDRMRSWGDVTAIVWGDGSASYAQLVADAAAWRGRLEAAGATAGTVVALQGDYSPGACALLLALIDIGAIAVPLTKTTGAKRDELLTIAEAELVVEFDESDTGRIVVSGRRVVNPLTLRLKATGHPGLVLFSSGSTGTSKAALHDFSAVLDKFRVLRQRKRMLTFLLLDHMGGINTLFYALSNGGSVVSVRDRDPDSIAGAIARHHVQLLPTSPTFLNLLMASGAHRRHDLSSLELITYGTEVMPERTLKLLHATFPNVALQQTYGLSEVGVLRSKSRSADSLWVKVGGEGFETKVVNGTLRIRAQSAMLGYLNAPDPFDAEGWLDTQDAVEVDGEYIRILGRQTDLINVGGQKVYPAEVESVLLEMPNVRDATVFGERHPLMGQIVAAAVVLREPEDDAALTGRVRAYCREKLERYKIPVRIEIVGESAYTERFKKLRPR